MATVLLTAHEPCRMDAARAALEHAAHRVIATCDETTAHNVLVSGLPDCALIDETVLKMCGLRLLAKLRAIHGTRPLRLTVMTSSPTDHATVMQTLGLTSDLLLEKPFEAEDALQAVSIMLGEAECLLAPQASDGRLYTPGLHRVVAAWCVNAP